jgi:hypothetical protein
MTRGCLTLKELLEGLAQAYFGSVTLEPMLVSFHYPPPPGHGGPHLLCT